MDIEKEVLKQFVGQVIDIDPGIYPKAWVGEYEKRTEHMNGRNEGVMEYYQLISDLLHDLGIEVYDGDNCIDAPRIVFK